MKIRVVPAQPHAFAYGGFDIQMHRTLEVLQALGVDAKPLDFWSRDSDFDIVHFWGFDTSHLLAARFAAQYGKKIVLTPLFPYVTPRTWMRNMASRIEGRARPRLELARLVDRFLVVNEEQRETARRFFNVPEHKIEVIPTMLDDRFFAGARSIASLANGFADFFLCAGNICARKNQVRLAEAAIATQTPILFTGNTTGGEEAYGAAFTQLVTAHPFLRWQKWLSWEELHRAYQACRGVALASFDEQQPGSGLEGAALGKPLLLGARRYARQKYFRNAFLVAPESVRDIAQGLMAIRATPAAYIPPQVFVEECRADRVGPKLKRIFEEVAAESRPTAGRAS